MIKIDVKADIEAARNGLGRIWTESKGIGRKILRALATVGKKRVRSRMGNYLRLGHTVASSGGNILTGAKGRRLAIGDTGEGLKGAVYGFARSETHAVISSGQRQKAEVLERGGTITAKKGKVLTFRGDDGQIRRAKTVTIPPKHWFSRSIAGLEDDPDYKTTPDKVLGKLIQKAMKT